jgi:phosphonate transport system permease protein
MNVSAVVKRQSRTKHYLTAILILILVWASAVQTGVSLDTFLKGLPQIGNLFSEMFPPNWNFFVKIINPMAQTVQIAILGTTFGAILAVPVSLCAARNVTKLAALIYVSRFILNLIRTIPDLLFAAIFVAIFGLGAVPGILALTFFSFGLISKLLYESIEAIDPGPLEAMTAVGANKFQFIWFGVIPQVLAQFTAYMLYTFEINVRAAAVLGLVGAGGIGLVLDETLGLLQYQKTCSIILFTLVLVLIIDFISTKLREKLL